MVNQRPAVVGILLVALACTPADAAWWDNLLKKGSAAPEAQAAIRVAADSTSGRGQASGDTPSSTDGQGSCQNPTSSSNANQHQGSGNEQCSAPPQEPAADGATEHTVGGSEPTAKQSGAADIAMDPNDPATLLIDWIRGHGGEVNVAITQPPGKHRGTFATKDLQHGDVLMSLPVELAYALDYGRLHGIETAGAELYYDMMTPDSFWSPVFKALPPKEAVVNLAFVPKKYLPILQDDNTEKAVQLLQDETRSACDRLQPKYQELGVTVTHEDCLYAMALIMTRAFWHGDTEVLLPVLDCANHVNSCPHTHNIEHCDPEKGRKQYDQSLPPPVAVPPTLGCGFNSTATGSSRCSASSPVTEASGHCIVWRAGGHVAAGQEVCNTYGTLLQDRSLLQYGFLQSGPVEQELSMMDRAEHSQIFKDVWDELPFQPGHEVPDKWKGTKKQMRGEVARQKARLHSLRAGDAAIAAIQPDESADPGGKILSLIRQWRQQRLDAIAAEIRRLEGLLGGVQTE